MQAGPCLQFGVMDNSFKAFPAEYTPKAFAVINVCLYPIKILVALCMHALVLGEIKMLGMVLFVSQPPNPNMHKFGLLCWLRC